MIRVTNARTMRSAAWAAMLVLCLPVAWGRGQQHGNAPRSAPHYSPPSVRSSAPQYRAPQNRAPQNRAPQYRPAPQPQGREQGRPQYQQSPSQGRYQDNGGQPAQNRMPAQGGYGANAARPAYQGSNSGANYGRPGYGSTPAYNGSRRPAYTGQGGAPPGHLEDWLSRHQNVPVQDQERMLKSDPSFNHQAPAQQQREVQQLHQLNQMPEAQRDRRLARNEMLERLSPEERMSINRSGREWAALPADRQGMMKRAFQDLRGVPLDQRQTVLNSARYQGAFSPQERNILSNFLRVEPYQPPQH